MPQEHARALDSPEPLLLGSLFRYAEDAPDFTPGGSGGAGRSGFRRGTQVNGCWSHMLLASQGNVLSQWSRQFPNSP